MRNNTITNFFDKEIVLNKKLLNGVEDPLIPFLITFLLIQNKKVFFIAKNDLEMSKIKDFVSLSLPICNILTIPAWDTLPYDISSPNKIINCNRIVSLTKIINQNFVKKNTLIISTFNALLIRNSPVSFYKNLFFNINITKNISINFIRDLLIEYGYEKVEIVREVGEFSIRGDILDAFINGYSNPFRINFFDLKIESIITFNPLSQRNIPNTNVDKFTIYSLTEYKLNKIRINLFKDKYKKSFELDIKNDFFYSLISSGQRSEGIEYFLKLFHDDKLSNIFDFISFNNSLKSIITISNKNCISLLSQRNDEINNFYFSRKAEEESNILHPNDIYLSFDEVESHLEKFKTLKIENNLDKNINSLDLNSKKLIFSEIKRNENNLSNMLSYLIEQHNDCKKVVICINEENKLKNIISYCEAKLRDFNIHFQVVKIVDLILQNHTCQFLFCRCSLDYSFQLHDYLFISENDLTGKTNKSNLSKSRKVENFLKDLTTLSIDDYVTHVDHGIGQYKSLKVLNISGYNHDCLQINYQDNDKLFIPVENINLISKFSDSTEKKVLDKLGSYNWQIKKKKIKEKINDIAQKLINTAANRNIQSFEKLYEPNNYNDFTQSFPFILTEDQEIAIEDVMNDIYSGKLMDRLICGDVGFGKTEIALRAAFVIASSGKQVALVAPTTILVEQHYQNFLLRFKSFNFKISYLSRMTKNKDKTRIKEELKKGLISIVIGTHALLSNDISFNDLGLLIIDEEQHFGVSQKERLKELQFNVHVLTLTATPIPRTLQLSLTGLKDLSLITTPPINRLSIRTFVQNWDKIILKDALLREKNRNGQSFVVCPKIKDIDSVFNLIKNMVPELSVIVAHGKLKISDLENSIKNFFLKKSDILISTNIIESGIDIPNANTLIVYNADFFGLSQLYQLRGRVGRSDVRAYAYFTFKKNKILTEKSYERLKVLKTLDNLGAGFTLANYDLDIRGAGNLLGDEQSGQIKEIGYELYQKMLKEAIDTLKNGKERIIETWSPTINLGLSVLIPETYVNDLVTRMSLYRKAGDLIKNNQIKDFLNELNERFGPPPKEVMNLIFTISLKIKCINININFVEVGSKGIVIGFRNNEFKNPEKLINWININPNVHLLKDQKILIEFDFDKKDKLIKLKEIIENLSNFNS